jgi:hypothetical protein
MTMIICLLLTGPSNSPLCLIVTQTAHNQGKYLAGLCHQVAAWVLDMFCNFYLAKNQKGAINWTTNEGSVKRRKFGILAILEKIQAVFE